jgi:hypothetical protein
MAAEGRRAFASVSRVIARAQHAGALRTDIALGDVLWILSGLAAPPNPVVARIVEDREAQMGRALTVVLDGLRPSLRSG